MSRRSFALGFAAAALLAAGVMLGAGFGRPQPVDAKPAEAKAAEPLRAGFVSAPELMSGYKKWAVKLDEVNVRRTEAATALTKTKAELDQLVQQCQAAKPDDQPDLMKKVQRQQRRFQDDEQAARERIDALCAKQLRELHDDVAGVIEEVARERKLDVVYSHPGLLKQLDSPAKSPMALDLYFRPTSAQPIYMKDGVDITPAVLERLNAEYAAQKKLD